MKKLIVCAMLVFLGGCDLTEESELVEEELEESPPEKKILYRGQIYTADELQAADMQIEHWAVDSALEEQGLVAGFDSAEESIQYLSSRHRERSSDVSVLSCDENAIFYDNPYYGDPYFYFTRGQQESDLGSIGWDDRIHSLRTPACPSVTILYEHPGFGGASISFGPSANIDSLADYKISTFHSWRNKASSLRVVGNLYYSASNTSSAQQNTVNHTVQLLAGQTISVGTCNVPTSYGAGDTYLRLFNPSGVQATANDDSCGLLSYYQHTAATGGAYQIRAGCFSSGSCSGMVSYTWE